MSDMCSVNLNIYGAANLTFNFGAANAVITAANAAANAIEGQTGTRASYVSTGSKDFKGYFSELFTSNAASGASDASELAIRLREVATFMGTLRDAATKENARRQRAREWKQRVESRKSNFLDRTWDSIFGEEPPPREEASTPPAFNAQTVRQSVRQHPSQGGGGGGGTSSARPSDLRSYASGTAALNSGLDSHPGSLSGAASDFMATCDFGAIDVGPVAAGFKAWQTANTADVTWANTVAASFEAAGAGEGVATVSNASLSAALDAAGVNASRANLMIAPPQAFGGVPTTGFANDPINTSTGNFLEPEIDLGFGGAASSLKFDRMYNSLNVEDGIFGTGWSSILDISLNLDDEGATFVQADGRHITFPRLDHGWDRADGENFWLAKELATNLSVLTDSNSAESWHTSEILVVRNNDGGWWAFTLIGTWLGQGSGPGTATVVVRDGDGDITQLAHEHGRFINVEYVDAKVCVLAASDGRRVEFSYDSATRLTGVTTAVGTRTYRWNEQGLIDQVTSAAGVVECVNTYDVNGRVIEQLTQFGRRVRFAYLPGRVTGISDLDGTNANTWVADQKGRLVGVIDTENHRQSMAYDAHGNLVSITERDKSVTVHGYDARGRKTRTVTPLGGDITYEYDDQDRVTTVVAESGGHITYQYAAPSDRNPSIITDPEGGVSTLTWDGSLLVKVVDPEGVAVTLTYDGFGDLIATTNAVGDTAQLIRDHAGRITTAITASGHATCYAYDGAGLLISREDPDGAIWRFQHGQGGKITAVIDPYGATTTTRYGAHGEVIQSTDPLGRAVSAKFDVMGNMETLTLPDGGQWSYIHDGLARCREITDPEGNVWSQDFDAVGHVTKLVDPTGVTAKFSALDGIYKTVSDFTEVTTTVDQYGRPITNQESGDASELITYDLCGRPAELLDPDGGLTVLTRDLSGRVTKVVTPNDQVTTYGYDLCGRPLTVQEGDGAITTLAYNADSRIISRTLPTGEVSTTEYDPCGRVISENVPGRGVSQYRYDKAGRVISCQDTMLGKRGFRYDKAGQLTQAINGLGGVFHYEYDSRGRVIRVTDPLGAVSAREFDGLDRIIAVTDPLGRATSAEYDGAGRQTSQTDEDGNTIRWAYDGAGLEKSFHVNGRLASSTTRDARTRTTTVTDPTGDPQSEAVHELVYNRLDQLVAKTTSTKKSGTKTMCWEYDRDGNRTAMISPDGQRTTFARDMVGQVTAIEHPVLGHIKITYDHCGRVTGTQSGDLMQTWEYQNGFPAVHTKTDEHGVATTVIARDRLGRITKITGPAQTVTYEYDGAGQLILAATDSGDTSTWAYDTAGRLTLQTRAQNETTFQYDAAGQLLARISTKDGTTEFTYDSMGRRIQELTVNQETCYGWDARGWLNSITLTSGDGDPEVTQLWVDVLGELTAINDVNVEWDSAAILPTLTSFDTKPVLTAPGGVTMTSGGLEVTGWRAARPTGAQDPWAMLAALDTGTAAVGLTQGGGLNLGGLEWMGARVYDPAAYGFLTTDPLPPTTGAGWAGNPYSFAGNNPLMALDPLGLSPVSDSDLGRYAQSTQGGLANATDWVKDNWEYIVAGAAIVVGVGLMFTGVGGPAGVALMVASGAALSGGISTASQKYQKGEVDWGEVGTNALIGGVAGGAGGAASLGMAKVAPALLNTGTKAGTAVATSTGRAATSAATAGATGNTLDYHFNTTGDKTAAGYFGSALAGGTTGAVFSVGGAKLSNAVTSRLPITPVYPLNPVGRHAMAPNVARANTITNELTNRTAGGIQGFSNEMIRPGGDRENAGWSTFRGVLTGASGATAPRHAR